MTTNRETPRAAHERVERTIPDAIYRAVLDRDNYQCQACGVMRDLHLHHWAHFRSAGGDHRPENLVTVCWKCHERIHNHDISIVLYELTPGNWFAFISGRYASHGA